MLENIRLAFQGIWSHKMRSVLTMLGIIIGIAAIITIVSTIKGTNEQIKENLIGAGNNVVTVQLNQGDYPYDLAGTAFPPVFVPSPRKPVGSWKKSGAQKRSPCTVPAVTPSRCISKTPSTTVSSTALMSII